MKPNWERSHRRVLTEFIKIYRSEPCLWMIKSAEYRDRNLKDVAYERLSEKLREIDSTADREKVVKKINSLRTNYRKEKKKLEEQEGNPKRQPRLWYYHLFNFLDGNELPGSSNFDTNDSQDTFDNFEEDDIQSNFLFEDCNGMEEISSVVEEQKPVIEERRNSLNSHEESSNQRATTKQTTSFEIEKTSMKRLRPNESSDEDDYIPVHSVKSLPAKHLRSEDRYDVFGRMIALKLRSIEDPRQRILAEKAINDAIFMAEIGELTLDNVNSLFNVGGQSETDIDYVNSSTTRRQDPIAAHEKTSGAHIVHAGKKRM